MIELLFIALVISFVGLVAVVCGFSFDLATNFKYEWNFKYVGGFSFCCFVVAMILALIGIGSILFGYN